MGVPKLFRAVIRALNDKYPGIIQDHLPYKVGSVYRLDIDFNALIHTASAPIYGRERFRTPQLIEQLNASDAEKVARRCYKLVFRLVNQINKEVGTTGVLVIAVDGMIPMAKIQQQKGRRYAASLELTRESTFDSNCVTPGTKFMIMLDRYFRDVLTRNYLSMNVKKIIYSSYLTPGEGEHKIFEYARMPNSPVPTSSDGWRVIYGMDADLIMISLISGEKKIILARDSIPISYKNDAGYRVPLNDRRSTDNIYIDELRTAIRHMLGGRKSAVADYVMALAMLGNDFIPHPLALSDMDTAAQSIVDALVSLGTSITDSDGRPNWKSFAGIIAHLAEREQSLIQTIADLPFVTGSDLLQQSRTPDGEIDPVKLRTLWYLNALGPRRFDELAELGITPRIVADDIGSMCYQFLRGIAWTYQYYSRGHNSVTWLWYYPYAYAPLMSDLNTFLQARLELDDLEFAQVDPVADEVRLGIGQQLVAVMPALSLGHVPPLLHPLWRKDSPINDLMPVGIPIDRRNTNKDWQALKIVIPANYDRIMNAVADLDTQNELRTYDPIDDIIYEISDFDRKLALDALNQRKAFRGAPRGRGPPRGGARARGGERGGGLERGSERGGRGGGSERDFKASRGGRERERDNSTYDRDFSRDGHRGYRGSRGGRGGDFGGRDRSRGAIDRSRGGPGRGGGLGRGKSRQDNVKEPVRRYSDLPNFGL